MPAPNDRELLEAAKAGDRRALEALLDRYQAHVYRFGMKMCGDAEDAQEILQDTLLTATRGLRDFRGESSLSTWLYTIARTFCIRRRRKSKFAPAREEPLESGAEVPDGRRGPDEELAGRQVEKVLDRAIRSLEPMYREVLVLRDVEGLPASEVAEVLGITVQAVKSRLHRARLAVREAVAPSLGIVAPAPKPACPDVLELLSKHLEGEISPDVCARMEQHVAECTSCKGACDSLRSTLAMCSRVPTPEVPAETKARIREALDRVLLQR